MKSPIRWRKYRTSLKTFVNNFLKKTSWEVYMSPFCSPDNALFEIVLKSKPIVWFLYRILMKTPIRWRKCRTSLKTFVNNFLKKSSWESILVHFVAVIKYFLSMCGTKCQYFHLFTKFSWSVELGAENVHFHGKISVNNFLKKTS